MESYAGLFDGVLVGYVTALSTEFFGQIGAFGEGAVGVAIGMIL